MSELVQFLLVKDQKKIPIKRVGEFRGALVTVSGVGLVVAKHFGVGSLQKPHWIHGGCLSISASPLFPADILKKVIREYKDVYSEIVNQAGRILQQVAGGSCVAVGFGVGIPPSLHPLD